TWISSDQTAQFPNSAAFAPATNYTVNVAGKDLFAHALLPPTSFSFQTAAAIAKPTVVNTSPANGASGVPTNAAISVTFSNSMSKASVQAAITIAPAVTCNFVWDAP